MRKLSLAIAGLLLLAPLATFAAFNDVNLTSVTLSVGGVTLVTSGSTADIQSITVNASTFSVVLAPGSSFRVTSSDRYVMTHDAIAAYVNDSVCDANSSTLAFYIPASSADSATVTVTPSTTVCTTSASSSSGGNGAIVSSGGGGGGGGTTYVAPVAPTPVTAPISSTNTNVGSPATNVPTFTVGVGSGNTNSAVMNLQIVLNMSPDTQISTSGVGSPGHETNFFGALTLKAVQKFQVKYGIAKPGDPGYGYVGPKTRAKLNELRGGVYTTTTTTTVSNQAQIDALMAQLKILQDQLKTLQH